MQRIIVELSSSDIANALGESPRVNSKIRSIEFLSLLRSTPREIAGVIQVEFKDSSTRFSDVFTDPSERVIVLRKEGAHRYICFYSRRPLRRLLRLSSSVPGAYLALPYAINEGRVLATLLGNKNSIQHFLRSLTKAKLSHRLVSLGDARFSPNSPMQLLTQKQQRVIQLAFRFGYYDIPRRVGSRDLAEKLGIRETTLIMHRRKAERKLLTEILDDNGNVRAAEHRRQ